MEERYCGLCRSPLDVCDCVAWEVEQRVAFCRRQEEAARGSVYGVVTVHKEDVDDCNYVYVTHSTHLSALVLEGGESVVVYSNWSWDGNGAEYVTGFRPLHRVLGLIRIKDLDKLRARCKRGEDPRSLKFPDVSPEQHRVALECVGKLLGR